MLEFCRSLRATARHVPRSVNQFGLFCHRCSISSSGQSQPSWCIVSQRHGWDWRCARSPARLVTILFELGKAHGAGVGRVEQGSGVPRQWGSDIALWVGLWTFDGALGDGVGMSTLIVDVAQRIQWLRLTKRTYGDSVQKLCMKVAGSQIRISVSGDQGRCQRWPLLLSLRFRSNRERLAGLLVVVCHIRVRCR